MKFYHDINAETANKTTALSATCLNGQNETNSLHKTKNGGSVLHVAHKKEHMRILKLLTDFGLIQQSKMKRMVSFTCSLLDWTNGSSKTID